MMLETNTTQTSGQKVQPDHKYYGHGKLLLSGEYFVMDGAHALALPLKLGQELSVSYSHSFDPKLTWKSYDANGELWFEGTYEFWHCRCLDENPSEIALFLEKILQQARIQNKHFLREEMDVLVETKLDFPYEWGLGSSSTLIYNVAQWAYISPFELAFNTFGGSGYDIACAQSDGPILYQRKSNGPHWSPISFNPKFTEELFFVYLGKKQETSSAIKYYQQKRPFEANVIETLSKITDDMKTADSLEEFEFLIQAHEKIVADNLGLKRVKDEMFPDYWGEIKSLGAWGGDFALVTSKLGAKLTKKYFEEKGHQVFFKYNDLILTSPDLTSKSSGHDLIQ
ncbi:MAG: GHMP kinase [Halobacteriovoraceae bacterium]|jgi:mevalonate kinase|nr:GHMP kinase [Halobacteriovoraceae bacterium]